MGLVTIKIMVGVTLQNFSIALVSHLAFRWHAYQISKEKDCTLALGHSSFFGNELV